MNEFQLEQIIINAKKKHRNIYSNVINGELFIWRLITHFEYQIINISSNGDLFTKEELLCEAAIIYPENFDLSLCNAGIPTALAPHIIRESGFGSHEKVHNTLNTCRMKIYKSFQEQAYVAIASAFPQYKFEEMETWDVEKLTEMVARAEWKINVIEGKDFMFEQDKPNEEDEEDIGEKEVLRELEKEIIEKGGDPILTLYETNYKQEKEYMPKRTIVGGRLNNIFREEVINDVREEVQQRLSNR